MPTDIVTFEHLFSIAEGFFDTLVVLDEFFFSTHSFKLPLMPYGSIIGYQDVTASLSAFLLGGSLSLFLGYRLVKFVFDF